MVLLGCLVALLASCSAVEEEPFVPIAGGPDCISAVIEPAAGSGPYYALLPYNNYAKRTDEGIYLWLSQRKYANTNDIAFGGVPMAGKYIDGNIQFRNIFDLLKVTFTSAVPVKIKQITLHDLGGTKTLDIKSLPAGTWYVSVYCPVTVTATQKTGSYNLDYFEYSGKMQVLDGVAYSLTVSKSH